MAGPELNCIYQGDCLEIMRGWPAASIDLVVADPPYMINVSSAGGGKLNPWADLCNAAYWYAAWIRECQRLIKPTGALWIFINWRGLPTIQKAAFDSGWDICSVLIWDKEWIGPGGPRGLRPSYEMVALLTGSEFAIPNRGIPDIRRAKWSSLKPSGHPAEKPESLITWILSISPGQIVLDPFCGSGTTLVSSERLGRNWLGCELNPDYIKIAEKRIAAETAQGKLF